MGAVGKYYLKKQGRLENMEDVDVLTDSVNPVRLGNNPVKLFQEVLRDLYSEIISAY